MKKSFSKLQISVVNLIFLMLNIPGETEMYTISGLDTEQTPATIEWKVESEPFTANARTLTQANQSCTPYLIAAYNSHLEIKAGRIISLIP